MEKGLKNNPKTIWKLEANGFTTEFQTRMADDGKPHIAGYFAVFDTPYELGPKMVETIARGAFTRTLKEQPDVRCLINHDSTLCAGRTTAGTLTIREDEIGLWGDVEINPKDFECMSAYARVERRDVTQCSFGFNIRSEDTEILPDGTYHWTLTDVELFEISICTFPAYESTSVEARTAQVKEMKRRDLQVWKNTMKGVLNNGT